MILDLDQFVSKERPFWDELTALLKKQEDNPDLRMSLDEAKRFHYLYERASSDLVKLNTFAGEVEASRYLENLVARAYSKLHEKRGTTIPFRPWKWWFGTFPNTFRRHWRAFVMSLSCLAAGMTFGVGIIKFDYDQKRNFIGNFGHLAGSPSERVAKEEKRDFDGFKDKHTFSAFLMQNNVRVTIFAMVLGIFFGVFTVVVLFYNGIILGVVLADYIIDGQAVFLTGWLLPHGSVEIPAILLGGQAGFIIAHAVFGWGSNLRLAQRFRLIRSDLLTIVGGASVLLVWAGIVEAFLSQYHGPHIYPYKIAFGIVEVVLLLALLLLGGRRFGKSETTTAAEAA